MRAALTEACGKRVARESHALLKGDYACLCVWRLDCFLRFCGGCGGEGVDESAVAESAGLAIALRWQDVEGLEGIEFCGARRGEGEGWADHHGDGCDDWDHLDESRGA